MPKTYAVIAPTLLLLCSCASGMPDLSGRSNGGPVSQPPKIWWNGALRIRAPDSDGWLQVGASDSGVSFSRSVSDVESFGAQVALFSLAPTETPEQLEALVKASVEQGAARNRETIQSVSYLGTNDRGYACVRYHVVVSNQASTHTTRPLPLETVGLYCHHPVRIDTGFSATYSHRGEKLDPSLVADAEEFFGGVQVPEHEAKPPQ